MLWALLTLSSNDPQKKHMESKRTVCIGICYATWACSIWVSAKAGTVRRQGVSACLLPLFEALIHWRISH